MKRVFKYIFLILATVMFLFISFKISNNYFINDYNLISMFEKKGSQLKLIKRIPESPNLNLTYECKGNAALSWDNTKRQIRFSSDTESAKCNLTFQYNVILTLNETSGTILKSNKKEVGIDGENYGTLTCESNNPTIASCTVTQTKLTVTGVNPGTATITVKDTTSDKQATFSATVTDVTLGLTPTSGNTTVNKTLTSEITGSGYGALTCTTSDALIATCSITGNILSVKAGTKDGVATITLKENAANKTATYIITVDILKLAWVRTFGGTNSDYFYDIKQTSDGGYIAVGTTWSDDIDVADITKNSSWDSTAIIVKYDASGNVVWKKFFGGTSTEQYNGVTEISGGYIAVGISSSKDGDLAGANPNGQYIATIVRYDTVGNVVWKKFLIGHDYNKIVTTTDGVIVAGTKLATCNWTIGGGPAQPRAAYIVKYNLSGSVVWQAYCHDKSTNDTQFYDIAETSGGYVVVGNKSANWGSTGYLLIAKYNASGTKLWEQAYGESGVWAELYGVVGGSEIVTVGTAEGEATMAKLNNNTGDVIWSYSYPGNSYDEFKSIAAVSDGYLVTGSSQSTNVTSSKGDKDGLILKINTSGNLVWARHFGGSGYDEFNDIIASSNKITAVGYSNSNDGDTVGINKGLLDATIYNFDY